MQSGCICCSSLFDQSPPLCGTCAVPRGGTHTTFPSSQTGFVKLGWYPATTPGLQGQPWSISPVQNSKIRMRRVAWCMGTSPQTRRGRKSVNSNIWMTKSHDAESNCFPKVCRSTKAPFLRLPFNERLYIRDLRPCADKDTLNPLPLVTLNISIDCSEDGSSS